MTAPTSKDRPFKVIIVGAGIAGLTLSNALQRADIDHIVLEAHEQVVHPSGASIGIWPNGSRLLSQLGCLDAVKDQCSEMNVSYNRSPDGTAFIVSKLFDEIVERHGYRYLLLERQEFIRALYEGLPSRMPIKTGRKMQQITEDERGIRVDMIDGTSEYGDMVVGCDGVFSRVRQVMWENANKAIPHTISEKEKRSLRVSYQCLVGLCPAIPGFASGSMTVTHNDGFSFLLFTQPGKIFFFVFKKLEKTYYWPSFPRYTQKDIDDEAAKLLALPVSDEILFGDIWNKRYRGELVNVEEGIFHHWHSGRIVLVGDAAHKFTPNIALGGITGMESAATLANLLRARLAAHPAGTFAHPTQGELAELFQSYQEKRIGRTRKISRLSTYITRIHAWENLAFKGISKYIFPLATDSIVAAIFSEHVKKGVTLDYVPVSQQGGSVSWEDENRAPSPRVWKMTVLAMLGVFVVYCACVKLGV